MRQKVYSESDIYAMEGKKIVNGFGFVESKNGEIDFSIIHDLIMKGEHNGNVLYVIRNYISSKWTQLITENFNKVINERGSHRLNDGFVSVQQIGSTQFKKNGSMYMEESNKSYDDLDRIFEGIPHDVVENLFLGKFLEECFLEQKIHFGSSRYKHGYACMATFRRWLDNGDMSLMPHEDKAQLIFAKKDDFEICKVPLVVAQNLCIEATGKGGELSIWNIQPDNNTRTYFGVEETGYPYPPQYIKHIDRIEVRLNPGDIYFMNACCIHGVRSVINGNRLTAGRFLGFADDRKVVYWT